MNRICLYIIRDKTGTVDDYILQSVTALKEHCCRLIVLCSKSIAERDYVRLSNSGAEVALTGLEKNRYSISIANAFGLLDREELQNIDWLWITGDWLMGPIRPLQPVFMQLEETAPDFWGLSACRTILSENGDHFRKTEPYLLGYFYAINHRLFSGNSFREYLDFHPGTVLPMENSDAEAFTRYFTSHGFRWQAFIPDKDLEDNRLNPMLFEPVQMIQEYGCPFFCKDIFSFPYKTLWHHSLADQGNKLYQFLEDDSTFDMDLLWQHLLRTCHLSELHRKLGMYQILPNTFAEEQIPYQIALIMHLHYSELFSSCYEYALSMPPESDIYITTTSAEKKADIEKLFSSGPWRKLDVRVIPNRGRDVGALLAGCADIVEKYDCVCFAHDKRSHSDEAKTHGEGFSDHCLQNILQSRELVSRVVEQFRSKPRLGLLFPPPPCHGGFVKSLNNEWTENFENTKILADQLNLHVPMDEIHEPIAPLGTMFWFRPSALKQLFDRGWCFSDFPAEPNEDDGTLLHAIERIYPYVAQQAGFYSMWCVSDEYAARYSVNLFQSMKHYMDMTYEDPFIRLILIRIKLALKRILPKKLWTGFKKEYNKLKG